MANPLQDPFREALRELAKAVPPDVIADFFVKATHAEIEDFFASTAWRDPCPVCGGNLLGPENSIHARARHARDRAEEEAEHVRETEEENRNADAAAAVYPDLIAFVKAGGSAEGWLKTIRADDDAILAARLAVNRYQEECEEEARQHFEQFDPDIEAIEAADDPESPLFRGTLNHLIHFIAETPGAGPEEWRDIVESMDGSAGGQELHRAAITKYETAMGLVRADRIRFVLDTPGMDDAAWGVKAIENGVNPLLVKIALAETLLA